MRSVRIINLEKEIDNKFISLINVNNRTEKRQNLKLKKMFVSCENDFHDEGNCIIMNRGFAELNNWKDDDIISILRVKKQVF